MSIKDKDRKARARYRKKVEELRVELYPTDLDIKIQIANRIVKGEKKATYIKRLIREDIKRANGKNGDIAVMDELHEIPCESIYKKGDGTGGEN